LHRRALRRQLDQPRWRRAIPFKCEIGPRTLDIDGELHIYDDAGDELDMNADETPAKATDCKQTNITWKWS
jgi:hypothetical protein